MIEKFYTLDLEGCEMLFVKINHVVKNKVLAF